MKDKLKTRYNELMNSPFGQGLVIGGVAGATATLGVLVATKANFTDPRTTLHIPDHIVKSIQETGLPVMATYEDVQLMIGPS